MNKDKNIDDILASLNDDDTPSEGFNRSNIYVYYNDINRLLSSIIYR